MPALKEVKEMQIAVLACIAAGVQGTPEPMHFEGIWQAGETLFFINRVWHDGEFPRPLRVFPDGITGGQDPKFPLWRVGYIPLTDRQVVTFSGRERTMAGPVIGEWHRGPFPLQAPPPDVGRPNAHGYAYMAALDFSIDGLPHRARFTRTGPRSGAPPEWEVIATRIAAPSSLYFAMGGAYEAPNAGLRFEILEATDGDIKGRLTVSGKVVACLGQIRGGLLMFFGYDPTTNELVYSDPGFLVWAATTELVPDLKKGEAVGADRVWMVYGGKSGFASFRPTDP